MKLICEICGPENDCICGPCQCQSCRILRGVVSDPVLLRYQLFESWQAIPKDERQPFFEWAHTENQKQAWALGVKPLHLQRQQRLWSVKFWRCEDINYHERGV